MRRLLEWALFIIVGVLAPLTIMIGCFGTGGAS